MLVPVFFRSPEGGLHNHVAAQVGAALAARWEVTILCRPGPFSDRMRRRCSVVHTDWEDIDDAAEVALANGPYDVIHTHPWASRRVAEKVAAELRIPLVVTHHNKKVDQLRRRGDRIDMVVAVSDFARRSIMEETGYSPERMTVIPNGVDRRVFRPSRRRRRRPGQVLLASRLDEHKSFVVELIEETFGLAASSPTDWRDVDWVIAGDGTEVSRVKAAARQLNSALGRDAVRLTGWLPAPELASAMARSEVVVAPGRSALEALACGAVTVAIGGRGYLGLLDGQVMLTGMAQNFGSRENGWDDYTPGTLLEDVARARDAEQADRRRRLGLAVARSHDQRIVDEKHQRLWEVVSQLPPRAAARSGTRGVRDSKRS